MCDVSQDSGLLPNAYKVETTFGDSASTALILSTVYRMASLNILNNRAALISQAEEIRQIVYSKIDTESGWYVSYPVFHILALTRSAGSHRPSTR